jgi:flagellar assembly protein FliH
MSSSKEGGFSDDELGTLSLWDVPDVSTGKSEDISLEDTEPTVLTAEDIDAVQKQAYQEAFVKGEAIGFEEGKKRVIKKVNICWKKKQKNLQNY